MSPLEVYDPSVLLGDESAVVKPAAPSEERTEEVKPSWKFAKLDCVGHLFEFEDGTTFRFPKVPLNTGGYGCTSEIVTEDSVLAENLRQFVRAGIAQVVEIE